MKKIQVLIFYGTSAELIKLWPLSSALKDETKVELLCTNQQPKELRALEKRLEISGVQHLRGFQKPNLVRKTEVIPWIITVVINGFRAVSRRRRIAKHEGGRAVVIVHGDTMTSVLGAFIGRLNRCEVIHVEAGLRSHDWRNPFPEEINRILTARLARLHFAPDEIAVKNLQGRGGRIVNTCGNTARDALKMMQQQIDIGEAVTAFTLVSLHRAELLSNIPILAQTIKEITESSVNNRIIMVLDSLTESTLRSENLLTMLQNSHIELREKMLYPEFLKLVLTATRVVTDSGGLQEECGFLGIRCLIHRKATERSDGLGITAHLSGWTKGAISEFLDEKVEPRSNNTNESCERGMSPTSIIIETLKTDGML